MVDSLPGTAQTAKGSVEVLSRRLVIVGSGAVAACVLAGVAIAAALGRDGTVRTRIFNALTSPENQRRTFRFLRAFLPVLVLRKRFVTSYDNTGTAIVALAADVRDVLARDRDFEVVYTPRITEVLDGRNFFLGMQDGPDYARDVGNMRAVARRTDVADIVVPFASKTAATFVAGRSGLDVPQDLTLRVPALLLGEYFGAPGPSEQEVIQWTTALFWFLFVDLGASPIAAAAAKAAHGPFCKYLDRTIAARKASDSTRDDLLGRCLKLQALGRPGMDDAGIRTNLAGLMIGAVPTTSKAAVQALDQLLAQPAALAGAHASAVANDDEQLAAFVFEALRFNPVNPIIYRRATSETTIGQGTHRSRTIPKGTMVLAANLSAMFDRTEITAPESFQAGRPWDEYILWGGGLHTCFGAHINRALIPTILKPLLQRTGLRRASGAAGHIDSGGTPFPIHFGVEFD